MNGSIMAEMRMNTLGGRKSVENHQLLMDSDSSGSEVQEFALPPKRPPQPRYRRRKSKDNMMMGKSLDRTDIHGCCLILFILLFIATVVSTAWLCIITVQLQAKFDVLHKQSTHQTDLLDGLTHNYSQVQTLNAKLSQQLQQTQVAQTSAGEKVTALHNTSQLIKTVQEKLNSQVAKFGTTTDQALKDIANIDNEILQLQSRMKTIEDSVASVQQVVGPSPNLEDVPVGGEPGLQQSVHYLMSNYSWVMSQVSLAQTSIVAAQDAFDTKGADLSSAKRRLSVLEASTESVLGQVKKHHFNITNIKRGLSHLQRQFRLSSVSHSTVQADNSTVTELPAGLARLGLRANSSLLDSVGVLANMVMEHHGAKTNDQMHNTSEAVVRLDDLYESLQKQVDVMSLQSLASDDMDVPAPATQQQQQSTCSCNVTLEELLFTANYTSIALRAKKLFLDMLGAHSNTNASSMTMGFDDDSVTAMMGAIKGILSNNSLESWSRYFAVYSQIMQKLGLFPAGIPGLNASIMSAPLSADGVNSPSATSVTVKATSPAAAAVTEKMIPSASTPAPTEETSVTTKRVLATTVKAPLVTKNSPLPTESSPVAAKNSTLLTEKAPVTTKNSTLPTMGSPGTAKNSTLPKENAPLTTKNSTLPKENAPVVTKNSTLPTENSPVTTNNSTLPVEKAPVVTKNFTLVASMPVPAERTPVVTENSPRNMSVSTEKAPIPAKSSPITEGHAPVAAENTSDVNISKASNNSAVDVNRAKSPTAATVVATSAQSAVTSPATSSAVSTTANSTAEQPVEVPQAEEPQLFAQEPEAAAGVHPLNTTMDTSILNTTSVPSRNVTDTSRHVISSNATLARHESALDVANVQSAPLTNSSDSAIFSLDAALDTKLTPSTAGSSLKDEGESPGTAGSSLKEKGEAEESNFSAMI